MNETLRQVLSVLGLFTAALAVYVFFNSIGAWFAKMRGRNQGP